jgi:dolichol-phosphate mannosyltransferase
MRRPLLSVVIPIRDEAELLAALHARLRLALDQIAENHEIIYINDGSRDESPNRLDALANAEPNVLVLHLSRNFGHQAAVSAGIDAASGRAVVVIDGDLQDPPEVIPSLVERWRGGFQVVHAVRRTRCEPFPLRVAYALFYRLYQLVAELDVPLDSGDFCLMDRAVVRALRALPERQRFVRGLRSFVGFKQTAVEYDRDARAAGRSKYSLGKLFALALDGLVSFSTLPLRLVTVLGAASATIALALTVWVLADALGRHSAPAGWASTLVVVLFLGAVQLIGLGIIGEYVGRIFLEAKQRPTYIIARRVRRRERIREGAQAAPHGTRAA